MTEKERDANLAEQIDLAKKYIEELPRWLRSTSYFSGTNHSSEAREPDQRPEDTEAIDQDLSGHCTAR